MNTANNKPDISGMEDLVRSINAAEVDEETADYVSIVSKLPSNVSKIFDSYSVEKETGWSSVEHHWCLADMPEGEFPRVYAYASLKALVAALASRDGTETAVWPMYGVPLRLTKTVYSKKGKVRYLLLPNNKAVAIKESDSEPEIIDQAILDGSVEIEEEGWMGDPSYFQEKNYFIEGYVSDTAFSADPDMDEDDDSDLVG